MTTDSKRPLGFWLKRADEAITARANEALAEVGLDRTRWQVLNLVATQPSLSRESLVVELRDFVDAQRLERLVSVMQEEGVVARDAFKLTEAGRELHRRALELQTAVRARTVEGVTQEEYDTTLAVLARIVANLD